MGVALTELLVLHETDIENFQGQVLAVDASMWIHQFLSSIRAPDGTPLMDEHGSTTSHLVGLFGRLPKLMGAGVRLCFVFDGKPPQLKAEERARRRELKAEATVKYALAQKEGDVEEMRKFASRTSHVTPEIIQESKDLLSALGIPFVQAPSEAEAQCAHMVRKGDAYAVATNDADALLFGAPRIVRNLSIAGKRKKSAKLSFETVMPELVSLKETCDALAITHDQLIALAMLIGTDYNRGGIKGIGPKKALGLVQKFGEDFPALFENVAWKDSFLQGWQEVFDAFHHMPFTEEYRMEWGIPSEDALHNLLVKKHSFSEERVKSTFGVLTEQMQHRKQKSLFEFG